MNELDAVFILIVIALPVILIMGARTSRSEPHNALEALDNLLKLLTLAGCLVLLLVMLIASAAKMGPP